jgi:hypothetical protein
MADEGLLIRIGADVDDAVKNVAKVPVALTEVGTAAKEMATSTAKSMGEMSSSVIKSSKAYDELNKSLDNIEAAFNSKWNPVVEKAAQEANKASNSTKVWIEHIQQGASATTKAGSDVAKGSNQAAFALNNLGRIAQDAPFGFIGIQNNINPLLESFQRLKAQTGSTGLALRAMAGGLVGPAGLGLAVSVITSLITVFAMHIGSTSKAVSTAKADIDYLKASQYEYAETLKKANEEAGKSLTNVAKLVEAAKLESTTYGQRKDILKQLQGISSQYFGDLKIEGGLIAGLTTAYERYAENIFKVAKAKAASQQIEKLGTEVAKLSGQINDLGNLQLSSKNGLVGGFEAAKEKFKELQALIDKGLGITFEDQKRLAELTGLSEQQVTTIVTKRQELRNREQNLIAQISDLAKQVATDDIKSVKIHEDKAKVLKTEADIMEDLKKANQLIGIEEAATGKNLDPQRISAIQSAIKSLLDIKISSTSKTVKDLSDQLRELSRPEYKKIGLFTEREGPTATPDITRALPSQNEHLLILDQIIAKQKEAAAETKKFQAGVADLGKSLVGTFENVFTELISGGGNALKIFGQYIQTIIMKLIAAAAISAILSAVTGGFGAGAKGGGFSALFGKISGLGSLFPAHAAGGITTGPHLAMVGDNASGKEAIIPFERMGEFLDNYGGGGNGGTLETRISGDDLVMILNRSNKRRSRNYG